MDVQATYYRRRAIVARQSAAGAIDPSVRAAFAEVANHWLALAEQVEWLRSVQHRRLRVDGAIGEVVAGERSGRGGWAPGREKGGAAALAVNSPAAGGRRRGPCPERRAAARCPRPRAVAAPRPPAAIRRR